MILVVTGFGDATADYLCGEMRRECVRYLRFDTDSDLSLVRIRFSSLGTRLRFGGEDYSPDSFSCVWYRRPKPVIPPVPKGTARDETIQIAWEWSESIEGFLSQIPTCRWINHPARNSLASHKIEQLIRARSFGLSVPETVVTQEPADVISIWESTQGRLIIKPLACGYIERENPKEDSQIYTNLVKSQDLDDLQLLACCPTLFQQAVEKVCDVRIVAIDNRLTAISLVANESGRQRVDIRRDNMSDVAYQQIPIPSAVQESLISLLRSYGLRFAAVDMAIDLENRWWFFEINPNGQWAWLDQVGAARIANDFVAAFRESVPQ